MLPSDRVKGNNLPNLFELTTILFFFNSLWPPSDPHLSGPVASHYGVHSKEKTALSQILKPIADDASTDNVISIDMNYLVT